MTAVSMSVTPLRSRPNPAYSALSLKLTPSNFPYHCSAVPRSPHRVSRPGLDSGLYLKAVNGDYHFLPFGIRLPLKADALRMSLGPPRCSPGLMTISSCLDDSTVLIRLPSFPILPPRMLVF